MLPPVYPTILSLVYKIKVEAHAEPQILYFSHWKTTPESMMAEIFYAFGK